MAPSNGRKLSRRATLVGVASLVGVAGAAALVSVNTRPDTMDDAERDTAAQTTGLVNVRNYGAQGNGTTDDTAAIKRAITAAAPGATVYFPAGTYLAAKINASGASGITMAGVQGESVLQYNRSRGTRNDSLLEWNSTKPAANDHDITIRDLTFRGEGALSEHQALLFLSAVDDVLVTNCTFLNMQGDAINIARTARGGIDSGVHNRRVEILDNTFDGIDRRGRNGVSIIDGDDILIQGNTFTRLASKSMPGAIDIEPNVFDTSAIVNDIRILDNTFRDNGGFAGDVGLSFVPSRPRTVLKTITVMRNTFTGTRAAHAVRMQWYQRPSAATDPDQQIVIAGNVINAPSASPNATQRAAIYFQGINGFAVEENTIRGWKNCAVGGAQGPMSLIRNGSIRWNEIENCGATTGCVINADYFHNLDVSNNTATSSTTLAAFMAITQAHNSSGLLLANNELTGFTGALYTSAAANAAQKTPETNAVYGNRGCTRQLNHPPFAKGRPN